MNVDSHTGVPQEGDGNYADSEPPNANATIARFVVIGGVPPATTPPYALQALDHLLRVMQFAALHSTLVVHFPRIVRNMGAFTWLSADVSAHVLTVSWDPL